MESPSGARVKIDGQGRMVLPRDLRDEIVTVPGEVLIRRTADGLLLTASEGAGTLDAGEDGLPVLRVGRVVTNAEVLSAIDRYRAER